MVHGSDVAGSESQFAAFVERLAGALGHAHRVAPMKPYCNRPTQNGIPIRTLLFRSIH